MFMYNVIHMIISITTGHTLHVTHAWIILAIDLLYVYVYIYIFTHNEHGGRYTGTSICICSWTLSDLDMKK